jgi:hypothetical protein
MQGGFTYKAHQSETQWRPRLSNIQSRGHLWDKTLPKRKKKLDRSRDAPIDRLPKRRNGIQQSKERKRVHQGKERIRQDRVETNEASLSGHRMVTIF